MYVCMYGKVVPPSKMRFVPVVIISLRIFSVISSSITTGAMLADAWAWPILK